MFFSVVIMVAITMTYSRMNREAKGMKTRSSKTEEDRSQNYAIQGDEEWINLTLESIKYFKL